MKYEKIKYPDGQISVVINHYGDGQIVERINSYEDLIFIKSISDAFHASGRQGLSIFIPCLFGQRSDRRFSKHQSFDLKIICDIINSCNFTKVEIFDPHSDVCLALINNSHKIDSFMYVLRCIKPGATDVTNLPNESEKDNIVLVSPDAGSYKKVFYYGELLGLPVVSANKHRGLDGKINLVFTGDVKGKTCLIVDDIADGGFTFVLLAKSLKDLGASKVNLYVSHGYFFKGFEELKKNIDHIYCTNSVRDIDDEFVTQFKINTLK